MNFTLTGSVDADSFTSETVDSDFETFIKTESQISSPSSSRRRPWQGNSGQANQLKLKLAEVI